MCKRILLSSQLQLEQLQNVSIDEDENLQLALKVAVVSWKALYFEPLLVELGP